MALVGFHYEPASLDIDKLCFDKEQGIPNTREKSRKIKSVTEWCRYGECGVMGTNVECLSCATKVKSLDTFNYLIMRYDDRHAVTKRVSTTALQFYLI